MLPVTTKALSLVFFSLIAYVVTSSVLVFAAPTFQRSLNLSLPFRPTFAPWIQPTQSIQFSLLVPISAVSRPEQALKISLTAASGNEVPRMFADFRVFAESSNARYLREPTNKANGDTSMIMIRNSDFVAAGSASGQEPPYILYITVECTALRESYCDFILAAYPESRTSIWPGSMMQDKAIVGTVTYYEVRPHWYNSTLYPLGTPVDAAIAADDIFVTAKVLRGQISIYIISTDFTNNQLPSPTNTQWQQPYYNNEVIVIGRTDRRVAAQSFLIAVYAENARTVEDEMVSYALQFSYRKQGVFSYDIQNEYCQWLSDGLPTPSVAFPDAEWDQFCFVHVSPTCAFDLTLTVLSGEADLYLWYDGSFHGETIDAGVGSDNIRFMPGVTKFFSLVAFTPNGQYGSYNVLYHSNCSDNTQLVPSLPYDPLSSGINIARDMQLMSRILPGQVEILRPLWQKHAAQVAAVAAASFMHPTSKSVLSGDVSFGKEWLGSDEQAMHQAADPVFHFPSLSHSAPSLNPKHDRHSFDLLSASASSVASSAFVSPLSATYSAIILTQGQPQYGEAETGQFIRYIYRPTSFDQDFTFEVTRNLGGDPNMYVSTSNALTLPMPHLAQWSSSANGNDYITVDRFDEQACVRRDCFYHIAIFIAEGSRVSNVTGFTMIASEGEAHTDLQNGRSYSNKLVAGSPDFLRFIVSEPGLDITFQLTDTGRANPRMYVSTIHKYPNATASEFQLLLNSASETLSIPSTNAYACTPLRTRPCTYWIAVTSGNTQNTTYSIVASAGGIIELRNAVYQQGSVREGQMAYYRYTVVEGYTRFAVSLGLLSGLGELYVGLTPGINRNVASTYVQFRNYSNLYTPITIYENNPALACSCGTSPCSSCTYYIGVYGVSGGNTGVVRFGLLATDGLRASAPARNGVPTVQTIPANVTYYWYAALVDDLQRIQVCMTVLNGDVQGYMSADPDNTYPDGTHSEQPWNVVPPGYACIYNPSTPMGFRYFSITNRSPVNSARVTVLFLSQVVDDDRSSIVQMVDGAPVSLTLYPEVTRTINQQVIVYPPNPSVYFDFDLDRTVPVLEFSLYTIAGDANLYLNYIAPSAATRWPTAAASDYRSVLLGSDMINVVNAQAGRYLGIIRNTNGSAFIMSASSGLMPVLLQSGVPVRGYVLTNQYKYYQLYVSNPFALVSVSLTASRGNPDLYANLGPGFAFDRSSAAYKSEVSGSDFITIRASLNSPFIVTIAVYAPSVASDYILVATTQEEFFLQNSVPVNGFVASNEYMYYAFQPRDLADSININVLTFTGAPRLLVSLINTRPSTANFTWQWSTFAGSNAYLNILSGDAASCRNRGIGLADCVYHISVFGNNNVNATYRIVAGQPGSGMIQLVNGNPTSGRLRPSESVFYYFQNYNFDSTVVFALTVLGGEADIYVSTFTRNPGPSNYTWSSARTGDDVLSILDATDLYYYVGIYNTLTNLDTEYTVLAQAYNASLPGDNALFLYRNQPQQDACAKNTYRYYLFYVAVTYTQVVIELDAIVGDPDISINSARLDQNTWPTWNAGRWNGVIIGSDIATINAPPTSDYLYIAVYSYQADSKYTITVRTPGAINSIFDGSTVSGVVSEGAFDYYLYNQYTPAANSTLVVSLIPETGNSDLFIVDTDTLPSLSNYNFTQADIGLNIDIIVLHENVKTDFLRSELHAGQYLIAVYGRVTSVYRLSVHYGTRLALRDSFSYASFVAINSIDYYTYEHPQSSNFTVSVFTYFGGYSYLYVSDNNRDPVPTQPATWFVSSVYVSSSLQETRITPRASGCTAGMCHYIIAVYAPPQVNIYGGSYYSIVAQNKFEIRLSTAEPVSGLVPAGGSIEYSFDVNCFQSNVTLTLVGQGAGNVDLLVNRGPSFPSRLLNNSLFESRFSGNNIDIVRFDWLNPVFAGGQSMAGIYYVSVVNESPSDVTYVVALNVRDGPICNIVATSSSSTAVALSSSSSTSSAVASSSTSSAVAPGFSPLKENVPVAGELLRGQYAFYSFTTPTTIQKAWPYGVYFTLLSSDATASDLFLRKDGDFPRFGYSQWSSRNSGDSVLVVVQQGGAGGTPCVPTNTGGCLYTIGVQASTSRARYSLTASTAGATFGVELDAPISTYSVSSNAWIYYVANVTSTTLPFVAIVTPLSGNPDLYVRYGSLPDFNSVTSKTFGVDVVTIPNPQLGQYFIGVYGQSVSPSASRYTMVATQSGIQLVNGQPQDDILGDSQRRFYYFDFSTTRTASEPFHFQIDDIAFEPQLEVYVRNDNLPLSDSSYTWRFVSNGTWPLGATVRSGEPSYSYDARYRILVISRSGTAAFALTATQGNAALTLANGRPVETTSPLARNSYQYYRVYVSTTEKDLVWSISIQYGSVSLYISPTVAMPSPTSYKYSNATQGSTSLVLNVPASDLHVGWYYAAVRADWTNARYTLVASTGAVLLQAGDSQTIQCIAGLRTFVLYLPWKTVEEIQPVVFYASPADWISTSYTQPILLYISSDRGVLEPSPTNGFTWSSTTWDWTHPFTISQYDVQLMACVRAGNCQLNVAIACRQRDNINLVLNVQVGESLLPVLPNSRTESYYLPYNSEVHYTMAISQSNFAQVVVESCQGQIQVFINSDRTTVPTLGNADMESMHINVTHSLFVPKAMNDARLMISLRGASPHAAHYIMRTFTNISWEDQSPQTLNDQLIVETWVNVPYQRIRLSLTPAQVPLAVRQGRISPSGGGWVGTLRYTVFYMEDGVEFGNMFSECGLYLRAHSVATVTSMDLEYLPQIMFLAPKSSPARYSISVHVMYVWRRTINNVNQEFRAPGFLVYQPVSNIRPGSGNVQPMPGDDSTGGNDISNTSEVIVNTTSNFYKILAGLGIPILCILFYVLYKKCKNTEDKSVTQVDGVDLLTDSFLPKEDSEKPSYVNVHDHTNGSNGINGLHGNGLHHTDHKDETRQYETSRNGLAAL